MGHILHEIWPFLVSVFDHWQIWLSGGGLGGLIVIAATLIERFTEWKLSKRQHFVLFLVAFFLCSCFLSWVDKDDALRESEKEKTGQYGQYSGLLTQAHNDYGQLRADCAYERGVVDTLSNQNRDQQNSINNCQTQAIKLLTPQPLKWIPLALDKTGKWILVTNKIVNPVDIIFSCSKQITEADVNIVSNPTTAKTVQLDAQKWETKISSPAWGPETPIVMDIKTLGSGDTVCSFTLRSGGI
jgi:hypothetical protein